MPCCAPPLTPCHTAPRACRPATHQALKISVRLDLYSGHGRSSLCQNAVHEKALAMPSHGTLRQPSNGALSSARGASTQGNVRRRTPLHSLRQHRVAISAYISVSLKVTQLAAFREGNLDNDVRLVEGFIVEGTPQDLLGAGRVARLRVQCRATVVRPAGNTSK